MLTFKNGFRWLVVMIGVLLLLSCAPSEMPEQEQETDDKQEPFIDLTPLTHRFTTRMTITTIATVATAF